MTYEMSRISKISRIAPGDAIFEIFEMSLNNSKMVHQTGGCFRNSSFPRLLEAQDPLFEKLSGPRTASQVEDFGLQAILEKMNSLNTPPFSGPFWNISKILKKFLMIS